MHLLGVEVAAGLAAASGVTSVEASLMEPAEMFTRFADLIGRRLNCHPRSAWIIDASRFCTGACWRFGGGRLCTAAGKVRGHCFAAARDGLARCNRWGAAEADVPWMWRGRLSVTVIFCWIRASSLWLSAGHARGPDADRCRPQPPGGCRPSGRSATGGTASADADPWRGRRDSGLVVGGGSAGEAGLDRCPVMV